MLWEQTPSVRLPMKCRKCSSFFHKFYCVLCITFFRDFILFVMFGKCSKSKKCYWIHSLFAANQGLSWDMQLKKLLWNYISEDGERTAGGLYLWCMQHASKTAGIWRSKGLLLLCGKGVNVVFTGRLVGTVESSVWFQVTLHWSLLRAWLQTLFYHGFSPGSSVV